MKGLILKDLIMFGTYGRVYIFIAVSMMIFAAVTGYISPLMFTLIFISLFPMTLQALDEKGKWDSYALMLPYNRADLVNSKFVFLLIVGSLSSVLVVIVSCIGTAIHDPASLSLIFPLVMLSVSLTVCAVSSIMMPFVFWLGAEKGRLVYMLFGGMLGALGGIVVGNNSLLFNVILKLSSGPWLSPVLLVFDAVVLSLSWFASVKLFERRKL